MLLAFLRYNFSTRKKIFMGDTGSLVIGFFLGLLGLRLLSLDFDTLPFIAIPRNSIPLLVLAILIVPTFDVSRVIFIRVIKKMSITSPDRNHIHHLLIDTGLSHKKASLLVGGVNFFIVFLMYFSLKIVGFNISIILFCLLFLVFSYLFLVINKGYSATKIKVKIKKKTTRFINFFSL
jgi:UDP-N-acetylmuramyl pentapeptide phosphotransferase/UDP-N-acetylglucosamine-1-phosphate transferase